MAKQPMMQHFEACKEVSYIQSINPAQPGGSFNYSADCFEGYRQMQVKAARRAGHHEQADQMLRNSWATTATFKR